MSCTNCFNGCAETVSDQCIKYTGIDVPALGILHGDTLLSVENAITNFLVPVLTGEGIKPIIDPEIICELVHGYLPACTVCTGFTLNEVLSAIVQATCDLQVQLDTVAVTLDELNSPYLIPQIPEDGPCLDVDGSAGTHDVLQAVIYKVCSLANDLITLTSDLETNYVRLDELDALIQNYLDTSGNELYYTKMIPYSVLPYFGPIDTFFNSSGAGTGTWLKIYLCNGNNGTPDLRGRALTGVINGVPGPTMNPAVDPSIPSSNNPNYSLYDIAGANQITLQPSQVPLLTHTHGSTAVATITPATHSHLTVGVNDNATLSNTTPIAPSHSTDGNLGYTLEGSTGDATKGKTTDVTISSTVIVTNTNTTLGGGLPHANIQPVTACYYIQYRP